MAFAGVTNNKQGNVMKQKNMFDRKAVHNGFMARHKSVRMASKRGRQVVGRLVRAVTGN